MLEICDSICCCFSCKTNEKVSSKKENQDIIKVQASTKKQNYLPNENSVDDEEDRIVCEFDFRDTISPDQNETNLKSVRKGESISISLHESIIEEEELDDAELCNSFTYMADGKNYDRKSVETDNGDESQSISDITVINVDIHNASCANSNCDTSSRSNNTLSENILLNSVKGVNRTLEGK